MSYFAQLDENDNVLNIVVLEKSDAESGQHGDPRLLIETDPRTFFGIHFGENGEPDNGTPLRGNYAIIGGKYDRVHDVFYNTQPYPSWTISAPTWRWTPPVEKPQRSEMFVNVWNESTLSWDQVPR
jgi:hypothetical protein